MTTLVITGGASGLGLAMAQYWSARTSNAHICVVDRNEDQKQQALDAIKNSGGHGYFFACDVTQDEQVDKLLSFVEQELPPVDVLINCAGVPTAGTVEGETLSAWQWVLDINLLGTVRLVKAFTPLFRQRAQGHIVNVASQAGITPMPIMGSYNATKAAIVAFSETLKLELAPFGIGVSVLCPAFVKTNLDKSLHEDQQNMQAVVSKLVQRGTVSPEQVAAKTYDAVAKNRFMIVTHKEGRSALRMKRWLPSLYYWLMAKKTKQFTQQGYANDASHHS